ncbi:SgcJ/EcaC family oxidoreductase [Nonomuraea muscovyensis]|uniref:YybH family protein n=1 Tax=Nonomuraea muscovyensis TaxID=1124761 RepID=UPI0033F88D5C
MTGSAAVGVLAELLHRWRQAFDAHRPSEMIALFSGDALFQGIEPELRRGREQISDYYARVPAGVTARATVLSAGWLGRGIVHGFADLTFTTPAGDTHPVRLSVVAGQEADRWLIRHYHAASRR